MAGHRSRIGTFTIEKNDDLSRLEHFIKQDVPSLDGLILNIKNQAPWDLLMLSDRGKDRKFFLEMTSRVLDALTQLSIPTVACLEQEVSGLALQIALACDYRFASQDAYFSLPYIHWGLLPYGKTISRLIPMIGLQAAWDMVLTGRKIPSQKALNIGLIHQRTPPFSMENQITQLFESKPTKQIKKQAWSLENSLLAKKVLYKRVKDLVDEKTGGIFSSTYQILNFLSEYAPGQEIDTLLKLLQTQETQSLLGIALMEFKRKKEGSPPKSRPIGILGGSPRLGGLAYLCAKKNQKIWLAEPRPGRMLEFFQGIHSRLLKDIDKRILTPGEIEPMMTRISGELTPIGFSQCGIVFEDLGLDNSTKKTVLKDLKKNEPGNWIFASYSEKPLLPSKNIFGLASHHDLRTPYFEVLYTDRSSLTLLQELLDFFSYYGIKAVGARGRFYAKGCLAALRGEVLLLLNEGFSIESVDLALKKLGSPLPLSKLDLGDLPPTGKKQDIQEIKDRLLYRWIKEAWEALGEGVFQTEDGADYASLFGGGFPMTLGGPFCYSKRVGKNQVLTGLKELEQKHGARFALSQNGSQYGL
jgi:3-hydroxyacyl-CoA dehydrogenase/enoyl-CoA hydratase/3-hydroxybutyryl-CoA epimerase